MKKKDFRSLKIKYVPNTKLHTTTLRVKKILFLLLFSSIFVFSSIPILAGTGPETSVPKVTLTVVNPDETNPTTPILISPANNSYVTTGKPTFVWEKSTDAFGIGKYQFYLNGSLVYDNLPTGDTETSNYIYTYDTVNEEYRLELKNSLSDGTYTWKVRVYDTNGNFADSATWTFTIDTLAPTFVITDIGEVSTTISAQDPGTIPATPIELENNEPLLVANGEANSTVQLTVTIPGDPTQSYTTTINPDGSWSLQLGVFERGDIISMDFIITDQAGLVSVISGVEFYIKEIIIVIPPVSPSPTPTPSISPSPSPSPTPGVTPSPEASPIPTPSISPSPSPSPTLPIIKIEVTPPREAALNLIQEIGEVIPEPIKALIKIIPEEVVKTVEDLAPVSAAIVATALPTASAFAMASQFGGNFSLQLLIKLLQSLGLIPVGKPQGIVFNSKTYDPVPFALLTIQSEQSNSVQTTETVVTDVHGVYRGIKLSPGMYHISVSHQDYIFPTTKPRPPYVQFKDYYMGEVFKVESEKQKQLFLIPVDAKESETTTKSFKTRFKIFLSRVGRLTQKLTVPLFFISGLLALIFPSLWNNAIFGLYALMVLQKFVKSLKRPIITGVVVDQNKKPLENAVIRIIAPETNEIISVLNTNKSGKFKVFAPKGVYHLEVNLIGYVWQEVAGTMSFYQVDASSKTQDLPIVMQSAQEIYKDLFE